MPLTNNGVGRDAALRRPRPEGRNERAKAPLFRRLTLRSATGTARRAVPTCIAFQFDIGTQRFTCNVGRGISSRGLEHSKTLCGLETALKRGASWTAVVLYRFSRVVDNCAKVDLNCHIVCERHNPAFLRRFPAKCAD